MCSIIHALRESVPSKSRPVGGKKKRPRCFPPSLPIGIDREELAWAAGFFDGEGSTMSVDRARQYPWLTITQGGTLEEPPRVLVRFRAAVGGVGYITGPEVFEDHPHWQPRWVYRVIGFELVQAVIALQWHHLGPVKRAQARAVLGRWLSRPHGRRGDGVRFGRRFNETCKRGHDYSDAYIDGRGHRECQPCRVISRAARLQRSMAERSNQTRLDGGAELRESRGRYRYFRPSSRSGTRRPSAAICGSTSVMYSRRASSFVRRLRPHSM